MALSPLLLLEVARAIFCEATGPGMSCATTCTVHGKEAAVASEKEAILGLRVAPLCVLFLGSSGKPRCIFNLMGGPPASLVHAASTLLNI